ncbi:CBP CCPA superfamily incomplete domain containing protein [Pandoravirus celtis]|uniref:CBP CCPA superfamily incomplete domain containing protein n=1 Tax=Pandoravirus celtis TaxID=2568002 RepID=A0A4D6EJV3_9VIRU|nr:CBP CCPA superfamily incomplete domain containing protein [Pandoravirus celtis]
MTTPMADVLTLVDLPAEVLCHIVGLLEHPRDVAACVGASTALACVSPLDTAASYYRGRSEAALAAGLPLRVVRALFERWEMRPEYRHLPAAAVGGHVAVLDWLCERLAPIPVYRTSLIGKVARYAPGPDPQRPQCTVQAMPKRPESEPPIARQSAPGQPPHYKRRRSRCSTQITPRRPDPEAPIARKSVSGRVPYWAEPFSTLSDSSTEEEEDARGRTAAPKSQTYGGSHSDFSRTSEDEAIHTEARVAADRGSDDMPWDCLVCAAAEAARLGRVSALRYLTTACPLINVPRTLLDVHLVAEAARQGALATVAYVHDRMTRSRPSRVSTCHCPKQVGEAAIEGAQYAILQWMHAARCSASPCNMASLARAIKEGDDKLVDVISDALVSGAHDPDREDQASTDQRQRDNAGTDMKHALASAARRGHLRALAIAHVRGFAPITTKLLGLAASSGRLDILRWAAGETVPGIEAHLAPPTNLPWDARKVVYAAARPDNPDVGVLQWLADRPETRVHFDVFMARTLIAYGCHRAVLWMHDAGLVSLASWDSVWTAVRARLEPAVLCEIIDRGAACSALAMATALEDFVDDRIVALLCERYGHADLAEAVRLHVYACDGMAVRWVRDNVPNVSVDHIIEVAKIFHAPLKHTEEPTIPSPPPLSSNSDGGDDNIWDDAWDDASL